MIILIIILWKCVYPGKKMDKESGYLYLDGSWYVNPMWQDSWPNQ